MIYFDLETTGLLLPPQADPRRQPRIVQAAWAEDDGPVRVELCDPGIPIPHEASRIHGITDAMVRGAQREKDLAWKLINLFQGFDSGKPMVAYNASFDFTVLGYAAVRHTIPWLWEPEIIDPMLMAEDRWGKRFKLMDLHERLLGHRPAVSHDAAADVESLRRVHRAMAVA